MKKLLIALVVWLCLWAIPAHAQTTYSPTCQALAGMVYPNLTTQEATAVAGYFYWDTCADTQDQPTAICTTNLNLWYYCTDEAPSGGGGYPAAGGDLTSPCKPTASQLDLIKLSGQCYLNAYRTAGTCYNVLQDFTDTCLISPGIVDKGSIALGCVGRDTDGTWCCDKWTRVYIDNANFVQTCFN